MHHIHHTEGIIIGSRPKGEDSKVLIIYTRELGLVYAHAQGIRKISSKLRFVLTDFSRANIDLVRGKEVWRVTTATPIANYFDSVKNFESEKIISRVFKLISRLVAGEEANEDIYNALIRMYDLLSVPSKTSEDYRLIELLTVARILVALGYLGRSSIDSPEELSDVANQHRLIRDINKALSETQL